jgi:LPS-assembly lipoprotein
MWWSRTLAAVVLAAALAGCGFRPMYKQTSAGGDTVSDFSDVIIAQPEDRRDQLLRNDLLDLLTPGGSPDRPRYLLEYRIDESIGAVFTTRSEEVTRNNIVVSVTYILRDYTTGKALSSFGTTTYASYNLTVADYSNLISEKNARERALRDSAEQVRIRLANFFQQRPDLKAAAKAKAAAGEAAGAGR